MQHKARKAFQHLLPQLVITSEHRTSQSPTHIAFHTISSWQDKHIMTPVQGIPKFYNDPEDAAQSHLRWNPAWPLVPKPHNRSRTVTSWRLNLEVMSVRLLARGQWSQALPTGVWRPISFTIWMYTAKNTSEQFRTRTGVLQIQQNWCFCMKQMSNSGRGLKKVTVSKVQSLLLLRQCVCFSATRSTYRTGW